MADKHMFNQQEGIPWEERQKIGWVPAFLKTIQKVLFQPDEFFTALNPHRPLKEPFLFFVIITCINIVLQVIFSLIQNNFKPVEILIAAVEIIPLVFLLTGFLHLGVLFFRGKGGIRDTFLVMLYSSTTGLFSPIPFVGLIIGTIWGLIIIIIGYKHVHQLKTGKAIGAYIIPLILIFLISFAVLIPKLIKAKQATTEVRGMLAKSALLMLSTEAEVYNTTNGRYPSTFNELESSHPSSHTSFAKKYCDTTVSGYAYKCKFSPKGYSITASPVNGAGRFLSVSTGGNIIEGK